MLRKYEITTVVSSDLPMEERNNLHKLIGEYLDKSKGSILSEEDWGEKRLAYPIKKNDKGIYSHYKLELDSESVAELENKLRLNDNFLRILLVKED